MDSTAPTSISKNSSKPRLSWLAVFHFLLLTILLFSVLTWLPSFVGRFGVDTLSADIMGHIAVASLASGLLFMLRDKRLSSQEQELAQLNRLYLVISNINQTIVHESDKEKMFQSACNIAVRDGGFLMAWIGMLQADGRLLPISYAGFAGDYLEHVNISLNDSQYAGPTSEALRGGCAVVCSNIAHDLRMRPWRDRALALGYMASAAIPLRFNNVTFGTFNLYSSSPDAFNERGMKLLEGIANDISFAIDLHAKTEANKKNMIALEDSQQKLMLALESAHLGMWDTNLESGVANVSDGYFTMLGLAPQSTASLDWWFERMHPDDREDVQTSLQLQLAENRPRLGVEFRSRHEDGTWHWLVGTGSIAARNGSGTPTRIIGVNMDITSRIEAEHERESDAMRAEGLLSLATAEASLSEKELLQYGVDLAERVTNSSIGFLHFVNEDQQTIELVAWSMVTHPHCTGTDDQHNSIDQAEIWADCLHLRKAVICNDYPNVSNKKGLPEEHFPLFRFISLPAISGDKVRLIMGIGNRNTEYTTHDVETVQLIANDLWRIVQRRRAEASLIENLKEQKLLNSKLEEAHNQLLQSEKMAAIGQLAAGVAHELNNPIGFVHSNLGTLEGYVNDLMEITDAWKTLKDDLGIDCPRSLDVETLMRTKDYDYICTDLPQLINESKDGLDRVRRIVQDLKDFSRAGESTWEWADLHQGLDSTLNIVWNELKYKCTIHKEYGQMPDVYCLPSQLNQVFMNLLVNASHAIENKGDITIRTGTTDERVWIQIADTGKGIPAEWLNKIFEPFFTTKPVGQGTGLGLSLSYSIMQRHHGSLTVRSEVGKGTSFRIELPIQQPGVNAPAGEVKT